jgi:hypothetical protein
MGKEKLEWFRFQQKRMGDYWCDINEYQHKCPICGGKLFSTHINMMIVMDGNTVIHCEDNEHTFYRSSWDMETILYFNKDASETSFDYETKYKLNDDKWIEVPKQIEN